MEVEQASTSASRGPLPRLEVSPIKIRDIPPPVDFGKAAYAMSRHRKNKVLVWQSRTLPGRVYEFVLATKFRIPGVYSWKCLQCSTIKQRVKKESGKILQNKIPLLLVDNDVIKENPDHPNNAAHFCEGRDVIDATVLRTKLVFYEAFSRRNLSMEQQTEAVEQGAATVTPFDLTVTEKETVKNHFNTEKAVENMNRVIKKRKKYPSRRAEPPKLERHPRCRKPVIPKSKPVITKMVKLMDSPVKEEQKINGHNELSPQMETKNVEEEIAPEEEGPIQTQTDGDSPLKNDASDISNEDFLEEDSSKIGTPDPGDPATVQVNSVQRPIMTCSPLTPLVICLDEEDEESDAHDEIIDVEGVDSS